MSSRHVFTHALRPTHAPLHLGLSLQLSQPPLRLYSIASDGANGRRGLLRCSAPKYHSTSAPTALASRNDCTLSAKIRTLMRSTPHALTTVISYASIPSSSNGTPSHKPYGLLVSSFNTITLDPKPYVSFNIKRPSRTYDAIYQSGSFTASGMSDAGIAHAFVKNGASPKIWEQMVGDGGKLKEGKGGVWWMSCALMKKKCIEIEDHVIIVGEVMEAAAYQDGEGRMGLVYAEGRYRRVGTPVNTDAEDLGQPQTSSVQVQT